MKSNPVLQIKTPGVKYQLCDDCNHPELVLKLCQLPDGSKTKCAHYELFKAGKLSRELWLAAFKEGSELFD
jgi:hypothetical protein